MLSFAYFILIVGKMATIIEIAKTEDSNTDKIHLFKEGLFWKVNDRSAFLFGKLVRPEYKVFRKQYKAIGREMVSLGFPDSILAGLFDPSKIEKADEMHLVVGLDAGVAFAEDEYRAWFSGIPLKETVRRKPDKQQQTAPTTISRVEEKIVNFRIEESTPLDCMAFLNSLKREVIESRNGNL